MKLSDIVAIFEIDKTARFFSDYYEQDKFIGQIQCYVEDDDVYMDTSKLNIAKDKIKAIDRDWHRTIPANPHKSSTAFTKEQENRIQQILADSIDDIIEAISLRQIRG